MAAKVFFSYSHVDESLRDELAKHLAIMQRSGVISAWHDRRIDAGSHLDGEISEHLETSDIVLLLVSADFFSSNYCYEREMERALERQRAGECTVIPVILRPCDWKHSPIAALRVTPTDGKPVTSFDNRDEAYTAIVEDIRRVAARHGADPKGEAPSIPAKATAQSEAKQVQPASPQTGRFNLRRKFTDHDRDSFLEEAFGVIARYFEQSLSALQSEAPHLHGKFQRIDARSFSASIYEEGRRAATAAIWYGADGIGRGLYYSTSGQAQGGSFNEMLSVADENQSLVLKPLGMTMMAREKGALGPDEAAEYFWSLLIRPLQ